MLSQSHIEEVVALALKEDAPNGDITSERLIPADASALAELSAREPGVFSGSAVFAAAFKLTDPSVSVTMHLHDGQPFVAGQSLATVSGPARAILTAERIGLNFIQRMCGIATLTSAYVEKTKGTKAEILDTRKTTPGFRAPEKWAVKIGGGENHRFALYDMIMLKDNHIDFAGGITLAIAKTKEYLKTNDLDLKIIVEARDLYEIEEILRESSLDCYWIPRKNFIFENKLKDEINLEFGEIQEVPLFSKINLEQKERGMKYNWELPHELRPSEIEAFSKQNIIAKQGYEVNKIDIKNKDIPDDIKDINEDITNKIIECAHSGECNHQCTEAFKIIPEELSFYKRMNLPIPRLCPNCRHYERLLQRNPMKLWHRKCMKPGCTNEFETSYSPDRPEIVYCENCYQQEII
jgi:nicotinate-nucleotide pyrophosphorylase (carboxylating)